MSFAGVFVMDMLGFVRGQLMMMEIGLSSVYVSTTERDNLLFTR